MLQSSPATWPLRMACSSAATGSCERLSDFALQKTRNAVFLTGKHARHDQLLVATYEQQPPRVTTNAGQHPDKAAAASLGKAREQT